MAYSTITVQKITDINKATDEGTFSALTSVVATDGGSPATYGAKCEIGTDNKTFILVYNANGSASKNFTIKAGNGIQGVNDYTVAVGSGKYRLIQIDTGRFKNVSGTDKGKVIFVGESTDIGVAVFELA